MAPRAKNEVKFELSGPGEIVGVDNGDATSFEPFQASERKAYNGLCLVIVRTKPNQAGVIKLTARAEGLTEATTEITATSSQ
jgi:beta-galactosidase